MVDVVWAFNVLNLDGVWDAFLDCGFLFRYPILVELSFLVERKKVHYGHLRSSYLD